MAQNPTPQLTKERLTALQSIPIEKTPSPAYIIHKGRLVENCRILSAISEKCGVKVLLALKGFACYATFPFISRYFSGTCASGLHEAYLAHEYFGKEVHVYSAAYKSNEITKLKHFAHTLIFNSISQLDLGLQQMNNSQHPEIGLRLNPEHSESNIQMYDPCAPSSRLGTTRASLDKSLKGLPGNSIKKIDGFHFHALCEQDSHALDRTLQAFEAKFGDLITGKKWLNFGGGHHITRSDYDTNHLCSLISDFRNRYNLDVYIEPSEAVALHTGILVTTVLDLIETNGTMIAILDTSATCHMPDVLEMPYRPNIQGADLPGVLPHTYRLGGLSCLAGDIIGDYSFTKPLNIGQRIAFLDMSHYTMVKNTTFNGVPLPAICIYDDKTDQLDIVRNFGYEDYRNRLS